MGSIEEITIKTVNALNQRIVDKVDIFILDAKKLNQTNQGLIENNVINIDNESNREMFFLNALNSFKGEGVYSFSYGSEEGYYYGARKNQEGKIEIIRNNGETRGHSLYYSVNKDMDVSDLVLDAGEFDPRSRAWYKAAKEAKGPIFSSVYKHFILDDLAISASIPIYGKNEELLGVLGSHMNLSRINNYLEEITLDENAYAIIVERKSGNLIANSLKGTNFIANPQELFTRKNISDLDHKAIKEAYDIYMTKGIDKYKSKYKNDEIHIEIIEYKDQGLDWIIITALPNNVLISSVKDNVKIVLLFTLLIIFLSSVYFYLITKRYINPINSLIQTQESFSKGDLNKRATILRNDEIGMVAGSFNLMADTIYDLINTLEDKVENRSLELNISNRALEESKDQLQLILNSTAEGIFGIDMEGNCTFINESGVSILGYDDQTEIVGKFIHSLIHHSYEDSSPMSPKECNMNKSLVGKKVRHIEDEVFWRKDGSSFSVEYNSYPQYQEGKIVGGVVTFSDNTQRKDMEKTIFNEKEHFKTTLLAVGDGVIAMDSQGFITVMNPAAEKLTGWSNEKVKNKPLEDILIILEEVSGNPQKDPIKKVLDSREVVEMDTSTMLISKNKDKIPIEYIASPIKDRDDNISGVVMVIRDITEKKEKLDRIRYLSMHDQLTGLYNRWYMDDAMNRLDTNRNLPFGVMVIDVNDLKYVNDVFGHKLGDDLLKALSKVLKNTLRTEDIIGRVGGDEFLILLPKTHKDELENIKYRIKKASSLEKLDSVTISVAIGYGIKKYDHEKLQDIIIYADNEMYKDKLKYEKTVRLK